MASVFFSYSHADEALRDQLEKQLSLLKRQGVIEVWHDRRIDGGQHFAKEIDHHIETDDIILLLVRADFLDSEYCYEKEMKRAMERHEAGEAIVIPVILRACDWQGAPFGKLNAIPTNGRPVTQHPDRDQALLEVAQTVRAAAERLATTRHGGERLPRRVDAPRTSREPSRPVTTLAPRSSNLRIAKSFTERAKDKFRLEAFEFMAKFLRIRLLNSRCVILASRATFGASTPTASRPPFTKTGRQLRAAPYSWVTGLSLTASLIQPPRQPHQMATMSF